MSNRFLASLALLCLLFTVLWLALLIAGLASAGPLTSFEQVLAYAARQDALFTLTYLNAALVTLSATALFAGLFAAHRRQIPGWAEVGLVFVPIYAAINLVVYLSQVTLVPGLLALRLDPAYRDVAEFLLRQAIQQWPASAVAQFNSLAYALLAIPSLIFAAPLLRLGGVLRLGGLWLALSAIASILGFAGALVHSELLGLGTLLGGVFFLLALICLAVGYFRRREMEPKVVEV
jgi:hypothetical protein